jgi:RNA polymerase sigma-70 factor (ECF subfamily)
MADIYTPLVANWLRRYELQASDADDVVQDVLMVVVRELPAFQHNGRLGAFRNWLKGILIHRLQHFWRSKQHRPLAGGDSDLARSLEQLADPHSALSREWSRQHDQHLVHQLLARLQGQFSQATTAAFRRLVLDGLPAADVAGELGLTVNAVVIAKCRVLKALRREGRGLLDHESDS